MDTLINEVEVNEICQKLASVSEGKTTISSNDAEDILALIANLITMNVDKRREEVEASIFEYLGESAIIENLGGEKLMDETFVQYLTANYTKSLVKGSGVTNYDLEGIGGSEIADDESGSSEKIILNEDVKRELLKMKSWGFDVFTISQYTNYALPVVTENALRDLQLISELELNETKLTRFLKAIQDAYLKLPYHNYLHAADVAQTTYSMCTDGNLVNALSVSKLGILALIIGAAIHDVSHPGVTGKFITAISGPLAIQYNDQSPLENMHLSKAFTLWNDPKHNFTERMPRIMYKDLRKMIIDMVLATDNDLHFNLVAKLTDLASSGELTTTRPKPTERTSDHTRPRGLSAEAAQYTPMKPWQLITLQITLHAADISGPAKPWDVHTRWTSLVMEEFYCQGDEERKLGAPITFAFDRHNKVPLPKFQMGFIKAIVQPLYKALTKVPGFNLSEALSCMDSNLSRWDAESQATTI